MNLFEADATRPRLRQKPLQVAPETFMIRAAMSPGGTTSTNLSSMLIRGAEPIIVDTGMVTDRATWVEDVFSLVAPKDVRWIFISHVDSDHAGNLVEALALCAKATVVISKLESFRAWASFGVPQERMRMVDNGQDFDAGDRVLRAVRPPVYDSPYTRGLFDPVTRVYYASDAFCAPMPAEPIDRVDDMPDAMWAEGFAQFHHTSLCPWVAMVDRARFETEVRKLANLGMEVIAGAHSPVIAGAAVSRAFELMADLPSATPAPLSVG